MKLHTWMTILMALFMNAYCSHASQVNYVKPNVNDTCPGEPCMTFGSYIEATETYFISDMQFILLPGEHYYDGNLRLSNITNTSFQGQDSTSAGHVVQIVFTPGSNLTFVASYNIALSNLSILLSGSQIAFDDVFVSIQFQNTSVQLSSLTVAGGNSTLASTAFFGRNSNIEMTDIQITGAKSLFGAALTVLNSTVTLSGSNTFNDNFAFGNGGAIYSIGSIITFSGVNHFENNFAGLSGGAIHSAFNSVLNINDSALFFRNRADGNAGAIGLDDSTLLLESNRILHLRENSAQLTGGAIYMSASNAQIKGQMIIQQNTARVGSFGMVSSNVTCDGKTLYINNSAVTEGGAIYLSSSSQMNLSSAVFEKNYAKIQGGAISITNNSQMIIQDSVVNNSAGGIGGAINLVNSLLEFSGDNYIESNMAALSSGGIDAFMSKIVFTGNNYFINNTAHGFGGAFSITLTNASVQGTLTFCNNSGLQGGAIYGISSNTVFDPYANVTFESNRATIQGGAIFSIDSTWSIKGSLTFHNNFATQGGAMSLVGSSKLILNKNSESVYSKNHAETNGGAIYFADRISINQCGVDENTTQSVAFCFKPNTTIKDMCKRQDDCFIELDADYPFNYSTSNISLMFMDNYAVKLGAAFYGGSLDNCRLYLGGGFQDGCGNKIGREYTDNPLPIILQISTIDNMSSAISSKPFRVCFCDRNGVPDCEMNAIVDNKIRGEIFTLSAVTVGQGNFTVPSSIKADFINSESTTLNRLQRIQDTGNTCTNISYRLFSAEDSVTMILFPDGPCRDTGIARREVRVTFLPCPDGFLLIGTECVCDRKLNVLNVTCNVDTKTFRREENNFWMMGIYDNSSYQGLLLHNSRCPFDFCVETTVEISLEDPDIQCNHNHSGILCGSCQEEFSVALGTLHCLPCSNAYLTLILVFALAGIVLVVFLLLLQLTVAYGTINGLIFYANVVQVNQDIFFPPGATNILTVFIAWLNLDLGIETCFYDGMNAYALIWLQFVFPFYIWFLIGFIIFLSHYSQRISRWLGDNPVSVLATLILLSYSKILRTIIAALSRTTLQYPDGTDQYVWLYDGSVPYFQRVDHIILGVFATFALFLLFLPYTFLLLTGHWLQAFSHWKIFSWLNKLKPFMDAYHGPFKKETRYWTGFLLLVRCALFLTFAFNALGSASVNLLTITSVTVGLTVLAWLQNRLYKKIYNDILEASFILNLCIFAAATYHVREIKGRQDKLSYTSVGVAFVILICIIIYHLFHHISKTSVWKKLPKYDFTAIRKVYHTKGDKAEASGQENGVQGIGSKFIREKVNFTELRESLLEN